MEDDKAYGFFPAHSKIIVVGDLHGDMDVMRKAFENAAQVAKQVGDSIEWIGGDTYVVIVGDLLDRNRPNMVQSTNGWGEGEIPNEEFEMLTYINTLNKAAKLQGGRIFKLLGNHEIMNFYDLDFSYVTKNAQQDRTTDVKPNGKLWKALQESGVFGILQIGDWIFVHGGILPSLIHDITDAGVAINKENNFFVRVNLGARWFLDNEPNHKKWAMRAFIPNQSDARKSDAIVWNADNSDDDAPTNCQNVQRTFEALLPHMQALGYKKSDTSHLHLVLGHSIQNFRGTQYSPNSEGYTYVYLDPKLTDNDRIGLQGPAILRKDAQSFQPMGINFSCRFPSKTDDGQVWRVDVGMSRSFDNKAETEAFLKDGMPHLQRYLFARQPQALAIFNDQTPRILISRHAPSRLLSLGAELNRKFQYLTLQDLGIVNLRRRLSAKELLALAMKVRRSFF